MRIEPIDLEISEVLKRLIEFQKQYDTMCLKIPTKYFGSFYCESSGVKCGKQCKYCKNEK